VEFRPDLWQQKSRIPGLSYGVGCVILVLAVLVELQHVTNGQTDGRTDRRTHGKSIYCANIASRDKNGLRDADHAPLGVI